MARQSVYKFAYYPNFDKLHQKLLSATDELSYFKTGSNRKILLDFFDTRYYLATRFNGIKTSKNKKYVIFNIGLRSTNNYPLYAIYHNSGSQKTFLKFDTRKCVEISTNFTKKELPRFCVLNNQIPKSIDFTNPKQFYYVEKHIINFNVAANSSPQKSDASHLYRIPKKITNLPDAKKYIKSQIDASIMYIHEQLKNGIKPNKIFAPFDYIGKDGKTKVNRKGFFFPISFIISGHRYVMVMAVEKDEKNIWAGKTIYELNKAIMHSFMWMDHKNYYMKSKFIHANTLVRDTLNR